MRRDEALDPRPPPGEFLFCLPVVGGHPTEETRPSPFRIHSDDIVLLPNRPSTAPFVVPEIKVPTSAEVADPSAAEGQGAFWERSVKVLELSFRGRRARGLSARTASRT